MKNVSLNNRFVTETYQKEGHRAEVKNGFAHLSQKITSKGLKVLVDGKLADGTPVPAGSVVYVNESLLHTAPWAAKPMESDLIGQPFLVIDAMYVDIVSIKGE